MSSSETWSSPFDRVLADAAPPVQTPASVYGTPQQDAALFPGQQEHQDTCAIRCQEFLITQFTGHDPGEDALVREAADHGWYGDHGTLPEDVGNLLEEHGIPISRYQPSNIFHLADELARGHKVIVGVHSEGLWHQHPILDEISEKLGLNHADHAVVVSGIDTSDPEHVQVLVSDPGDGQAIARYPMDQFLHAWKDSDFFMVATQDPPPPEAKLPEMVHFDYGQGHIDSVLGHSYDDFAALGTNPEGFEAELGRIFQEIGHAVVPLVPGLSEHGFEQLLDAPHPDHHPTESDPVRDDGGHHPVDAGHDFGHFGADTSDIHDDPTNFSDDTF